MSSTISLRDLAQRIDQQQAELAKLRQEYEARQAQLQELLRLKEDLQIQLRQVEAEIQGIAPGSKPPESKPTVGGTAAKPAPTKPETKLSGSVTLLQLLVQIVAQAGRPITIKKLAAEVVRRKYPTSSQNLPALIGERVKYLVKKGRLRRAPNRQGVLLAQAPVKTPAAKSGSGASGTKPKTLPVAGTATSTPATASTSALTLPAVVTKILAGSPEPILGRELADKVLASGYQTKSKDFLNVIWVGVGKMDNVENVPGKGYRLKKGKTAAAASKRTGKGSK